MRLKATDLRPFDNGVFSELFLRYSVRRIRGTLAPFLWVPIMFSIYIVPLTLTIAIAKMLYIFKV